LAVFAADGPKYGTSAAVKIEIPGTSPRMTKKGSPRKTKK
jgi:hypothetical protein